MRVAPQVMRCTMLGFALVVGAAGAHAQSVITRQIDNEPVEVTVTRTPTGTIITRRPLAAPAVSGVETVPAPAAAPPTYVDETVGVAPTTRTTTHRVVHHARRATTERTVTRTVRTTRRVAAAPPLVLAPAQRQVIYRTLVQEQVVPAAPSVPGYPPFPPPAVPARTVVVVPNATTGYGVATPADTIDEEVYGEPAPAVTYTVGSVLPARVELAPLPAPAAVAVPVARPYRYATVDGRVLLVDPATNTVVADITP